MLGVILYARLSGPLSVKQSCCCHEHGTFAQQDVALSNQRESSDKASRHYSSVPRIQLVQNDLILKDYTIRTEYRKVCL